MNRIAMNEAEWRAALHALNELRTTLIKEGRYTDVVDSVILKINKARIRRVNVTFAQ